jgi:predicted RNA-binding Zn-ribbon protein involved in translation (DUF1610 family)
MQAIATIEEKALIEEKAAKLLVGTHCPNCGSVNCGRLKRSSIEKLLSNATLGFYGNRKYRCFNCLDTFFK